jgi:hypothetical protein
MSHAVCLAVAFGLLFSPGAQAQERTTGGGGQSRPVELCEAFPWDVPVEQSFTVASVLRWRRGEHDVRQARKSVRDGSH